MSLASRSLGRAAVCEKLSLVWDGDYARSLLKRRRELSCLVIR